MVFFVFGLYVIEVIFFGCGGCEDFGLLIKILVVVVLGELKFLFNFYYY